MLVLTYDRSLGEADVKSIRAAVQGEASSKGLGPQQGFLLVFVVDELCCNVMEHGRATWMDLRLEANAAGFGLTLSDNGVVFDTAHETRKASTSDLLQQEERRMGLSLIGRLVDDVYYKRTPEGINQVQISKAF